MHMILDIKVSRFFANFFFKMRILKSTGANAISVSEVDKLTLDKLIR